ncbi:hypothetical protein RHGRI_010823 [Rhododendron griersonianum]|uniref:Pulmonary surfactant-associated protein B n=3 Tax=Rhododendron TaxID=4346 RepID=A0AAV6KKB6_9ERIC|nr:hypothetical protein RHGRI_010823 [Rhododendron griersonianum]
MSKSPNPNPSLCGKEELKLPAPPRSSLLKPSRYYSLVTFPRASATGTMGVTVGLVVLFIYGGSWVCDARELMSSSLSSRETMIYEVSANCLFVGIAYFVLTTGPWATRTVAHLLLKDIPALVLQMSHNDSEGEVKALEVGGNENVCTMCEEFAAEAIKYLVENKTQLEIIDILHKTCSQLVPLEQQCITLVDYYVPFLFQEIGSVQPGEFCQTVNLCEPRVVTSVPLSEDKCEICEYAVEEVLLKLKDPDTQLDILELLLKACDAVESYVKKCKTMVLEYGPLILSNAEEFLETVDICTVIHACDLPYAGSEQATPIQ